MVYTIDIVLIAVLALVILISAKKGFVMSLFDLIGTIVSFVLARMFSASVAPVFYSKFIEHSAESYLAGSLGNVGTTDYIAQAEQALASIPESLNGMLQMLGIDKAELAQKVSDAKLGGDNLVETIMNNIVEPLATSLVKIIIFVLSVIVIGLILKIVIKLLDKIIKKIPGIKSFNTLLGAIFGVIRGTLIVVVISIMIIFIGGFINNESFIQNVNNSYILNFVQSLITSISGFNI